MFLPFFVATLVVGTTAFLWRTSFTSLSTYVLFASLTVLGLHRVLQILSEVIKPFFISGYVLEKAKHQTFIEAAQQVITVEVIVISAVLAVTSWPLLSWLRALLSK